MIRAQWDHLRLEDVSTPGLVALLELVMTELERRHREEDAGHALARARRAQLAGVIPRPESRKA